MIAELLTEGLARIQFVGDNKSIPWALCKTRKDQKCADCGEYIPKGNAAFRPVGNGMGRRRRLHVGCVIEAARHGPMRNLKSKKGS